MLKEYNKMLSQDICILKEYTNMPSQDASILKEYNKMLSKGFEPQVNFVQLQLKWHANHKTIHYWQEPQKKDNRSFNYSKWK